MIIKDGKAVFYLAAPRLSCGSDRLIDENWKMLPESPGSNLLVKPVESTLLLMSWLSLKWRSDVLR